MEKPVEIVEKCEFSTAIPENSNSAQKEMNGFEQLYPVPAHENMKLCRRRNQWVICKR